MRYTKIALLFAIAMTPWLAQTRTVEAIYGLGYTEKQQKAEAIAKASAAIQNARAEKNTKILEISKVSGDTSKVMFAGKELMINLTESMWGIRKDIQNSGFGNGYTNTFINSRKNITAATFIKIMAEVYFCLLYRGIQHVSSFTVTATKNTTYEFLQKADSVNPRTAESDLAMQMVLTLVANNKITPEGGAGMPLHESLASDRAEALETLYEKYNIAY